MIVLSIKRNNNYLKFSIVFDVTLHIRFFPPSVLVLLLEVIEQIAFQVLEIVSIIEVITTYSVIGSMYIVHIIL